MTIGISKGRLQGKITELANQGMNREENLLLSLLEECEELDPWLPIDENTPKATMLLLGRLEDNYKVVGQYLNAGYWVDQGQNYIEVTHYKKQF